MTRSLHDNFVLGYAVDAETASILIRTEYRDRGKPFERTNARFEGVVGYMYASEFAWGTRYGWPWAQAAEVAPADHVSSLGAKAFRVQSSIGFDGFVIARKLVVEPADQARQNGG